MREPFERLPQKWKQQCAEAALSFASFTVAAYRLGIMGRAIPGGVRCTLLPKEAPQLPIFPVNKHSGIVPHNGVPLVSQVNLEKTGNLGTSTVIVHRRTLLEQEPGSVVAVHCGSREPYYYLRLAGRRKIR